MEGVQIDNPADIGIGIGVGCNSSVDGIASSRGGSDADIDMDNVVTEI